MINLLFKFYQSLILIVPNISNRIKYLMLDITYGKKFVVKGSLFLKGKGQIKIGNNVTINSSHLYNPIGGQEFTSIVVEKDASLVIENNVGISNSTIYCSKSILIEDYVLIGGNCKIYDTNFHSIYVRHRKNVPETDIKSSPVIIRSGVFIGAGSIILKGVEIGKNSVIGAGSVVSKNIPSNEVWGGNPVKFIKKIKN
ncbi:acyltransferase [Polaribacter sp. WD7]|uniref:acyltransferase n=1 Tax=Polaribacter sp. WD7 TaxID=2269061 RepID=UPI000DF1DC1C|nr:acyltransferase [Polaribacter sp. WD7]RCS26237.1 acyltransferase [Polaribacter sp. WD7]